MEYDFNTDIIVSEEEVEEVGSAADPMESTESEEVGSAADPMESTESEEVGSAADPMESTESDMQINHESFTSTDISVTDISAITMRLDCIIAILLISFALTSIKKWFRGYSYAKRN